MLAWKSNSYSVQCPFNDLLDNARDKGMYQSMTEEAFLTVEVLVAIIGGTIVEFS